MNYYLLSAITIGSSLLPVVVCAARFKLLDKASRVFFLLLLISFVTECLAILVAFKYGNNLAVYNLANLSQIFVIAVYFNYTIKLFEQWNLGYLIGLLSALFGVLNLIYFEPINVYNSNFFLYQTILVISLGLSLYIQFLYFEHYFKMHNSVHFWLVLVLMFFYALNYGNMSLYKYLTEHLPESKSAIDAAIVILNGITNVCFAVIFFLYPKFKRNHA